MELPSHPESDVERDHEPANRAGAASRGGSKASWGQVLVFGAIGALVLVMVVLHLLGVVGPGAQ